MAFYGSRRASGDACYLFDAQVFHIEERDTGAFHFFQRGKCAVDVHLFPYVVLRGAPLGVHFAVVYAVCFFPVAKIVIKDVICNTVEPSGEAGQVLERGYMGVCLDEGVLCQVVAQFAVAARQVEEEPPHGRLVFPDQLVECFGVAEHNDLRH